MNFLTATQLKERIVVPNPSNFKQQPRRWMASPVQLRFAASCKLLQITSITRWIVIGVLQQHDPGGSNGISKRVLSRVLDEMHTLRCQQRRTFTRRINTENLGKPVFGKLVSGSYLRVVSSSPSVSFFFHFFSFFSISPFVQSSPSDIYKSRESLRWNLDPLSCSLDFSSPLLFDSFFFLVF